MLIDKKSEDTCTYLPKPYEKFTEYLVSIKGGGKLGDPHLWVIVSFLVACTLIYYAEQILSVTNISVDIDFFYTVHDLHRMLFLIPLIYASITYRLRGSIICSLIFLCVILPRSLFFSAFPDPLMRPLIFFFFASVLSILIAVQIRYIEYHVKMRGDLQRLTEEVALISGTKENLIRFFNMAAHDMKSPLAAVQNYLNTMLEGFCGELTEKQKHWLERSSARIEVLTELIGDLLDLARIEKGAVVRDMREFSLVEEIKQCVDDLRQMAVAKELNLVTETDEDLHNVYGSDVLIRRVLTNLIGNAINYTPNGGEITVKAINRGDGVLVEVIDNGIGIPEAELSKIFQDFYRASNAKNIKGTGLGLSIVKSILEIHGGEVWVESPVPGSKRGCKFSFSLPIRNVITNPASRFGPELVSDLKSD